MEVSQEYRYQLVDEERRFEWRDPEKFNRMAFALHVLDVLRPSMNITLYPRSGSLRIRQGIDWKHGPTAVWAMIGIPPDASRRYIVHALAELTGASDVPFIVDLLCHSPGVPAAG